MTRPQFFLRLSILSVITLMGSGFIAVSQESHRTDVEYLLWKWDYLGYDPWVALKYLNLDVSLRHSLVGKTESEVKKWFPILVMPENGTEYQKQYSDWVKETEFLWIDESAWVIEFENGKVKGFRLLKG